jgi:hypothetical protein
VAAPDVILADPDVSIQNAVVGFLAFFAVNGVAVLAGLWLGRRAKVSLLAAGQRRTDFVITAVPVGIGIAAYLVVNTLLFAAIRSLVV